jgi:polysaccharide export outer membrane protein
MVVLLLTAFFCGVAPGQSPFTHDPLSGATTLATNIAVATESAVSPEGGAYALDDKHKLAVGDKISFQIIEDRDPAKSLTVTDSGELDVPYVGRVVALSKTCKQLAQELKVLLEKEFYYRASVVIGLDSVSKVRGRLYIWGQVRNQGPIEIPAGENLTVGKVILRAGGFADFANKKKVKLVRTNPDGKNQTFELNMVVIMEDGRTELDMAVQEDDAIIVPARLINF